MVEIYWYCIYVLCGLCVFWYQTEKLYIFVLFNNQDIVSIVFLQVFDQDNDIFVVFFSPSGVQFALPVLKAVCDFALLKVWKLAVL